MSVQKPPTPAQIERAAERRLRLVAEKTARLLRPVPQDIPEDHPNAAAIAGLRALADFLAVTPEMPKVDISARSFVCEWESPGKYDEHRSVDKIHNIARILGVEPTTHLSAGGSRHWRATSKFGTAEVEFCYVTDGGEAAAYRAPADGGDPS